MIENKKLRCHVCNKQINQTMSIKCKCNVLLCLSHRFPDSHECSFNFVQNNQDKLSKLLTRIEYEKINKI